MTAPTFVVIHSVSVVVSEQHDGTVRVDIDHPGDITAEHVVVYVNGQHVDLSWSD